MNTQNISVGGEATTEAFTRRSYVRTSRRAGTARGQ